MPRLLQVAVFEYQRNVFKKSFFFTLISVPALIAFSVGMGLFMESRQQTSLPVGILDLAGVLEPAFILPEVQAKWSQEYDEPITMTAYQTEPEARAALEAEEIQAYFILPEDYLQTGHVEVVFKKEPGSDAWRQFRDVLRANLLSGQPTEVVKQAILGMNFIVRSIDGKREVPQSEGPTFRLMMPLFIAMSFLFMLLISSGYITSALADEKENRTMEVLVTTVSPIQLIAGKVLGIAAISLTLLLSWAAVMAGGIFISRQAGVAWFNDLSMDWRSVAVVVTIGLPAYLLAVALMVAIGAMVTTVQEGQSLSGFFILMHLLPMYITFSFLNEPHNSLAITLSLLPFTSLMTIGMRNLFTVVPGWQVAASVAVQCICACGAVWLASRAFRLGMLRYGQRLSFRSLLGKSSA